MLKPMKQSRVTNSILDYPFTLDLAKVLPPFFISRILIIAIGFFSLYFQSSPDYPIPVQVERGYSFSPVRVLDMFARYDTGWYLSVTRFGYSLKDDSSTTQSNIAFFPLYPMLVRFVSSLRPGSGTTFVLLCGIILSNLFFLASLVIFKRLAHHLGFDQEVGDRATWYLCFFPVSFFFSSFYTESLYLFLSLAVFYAALREKWWLAGISGYLVALTRVTGVLTAVGVLIIYMEKIHWNFRKIRWNILWVGSAPLGIISFLVYLYPITGDLLKPLFIQSAWGRTLMPPWDTLFSSTNYRPFITTLDQILMIIFLALAVVSLIKLPSKSLGIFSLLSMGTVLVSGSLLASSRYLMVIFPIFLLLGHWGRNRLVDRTLLLISAAFLAILMAAWVRFYWVA